MDLSKEDKFWNWFENNNSKYLELDEINSSEREALLDEFLENLHQYSEGLFFQIGRNSNEKQELIISADGNLKYFGKIEQLVTSAPKMDNWLIIAFKPSLGIDFVIEYENIEIDPRELWFLPLENKSSPELFGLRIGIVDYESKKEKDFLSAAYQILDTILGEKSNALDIHHVEIAKLPDSPEGNGYIELKELTEYLKWRKEKISKQ